MAHAYTPGLRVTRHAVIQKERRLPLKGEVVVERGVDERGIEHAVLIPRHRACAAGRCQRNMGGWWRVRLC